MKIQFHKYQGTGNDFILIDNRELLFPKNRTKLIHKLCDRRFGIGADGLILLQNKSGFDFEMMYYNSDGKEGSMCGNGGRCTVAFAKKLGLIDDKTNFTAVDGAHEAIVKNETVSLKMSNVNGIEKIGKDYFLNTGSPHYVRYVSNISTLDVVKEGRKVRTNERFNKQGTNVNFVEQKEGVLQVRTYERGVEDETLSCGTGVTAVALIAAYKKSKSNAKQFSIKTLGGKLKVAFYQNSMNAFTDIWLIGPAELVFSGEYSI
jgi:diaminopimelate epimerase